MRETRRDCGEWGDKRGENREETEERREMKERREERTYKLE